MRTLQSKCGPTQKRTPRQSRMLCAIGQVLILCAQWQRKASRPSLVSVISTMVATQQWRCMHLDKWIENWCDEDATSQRACSI
mmetsp:Transcript_52004/g.138640  ORF Transcript_52004/g.138640 Transcript_52004/m.138640 type:complete len:83 (-) Transcript_52004:386-634(-)